MKSVIFVAIMLTLAAASVHAFLNVQQYEWLFNSWMTEHGKEYETGDEQVFRFGVWKENLDFIHRHNKKNLSYKLGMNQFGDLTRDEWKQRFGTLPSKPSTRPTTALPKLKTPPTSWDWRTKGAVNPVQNQGQCGSCWAFTTGDSVSGIWAIKTGMLFPVSVQEIIDCSGPEGNQGCNGGLVDQAMQWVIANGGICDWQEYAYTAETGTTCMSTNCTNVAKITGYVDVTSGDENALMAAVYAQPVSTAVEADQQVFQFYTSGILDDPSCGQNIDHGMTIVGWGTEAGKDYWILRNMWGTSWGEQGYIRLVRGKNECGLAVSPTYAELQLP
jgi:C1A family cysteine protease